MIKTILTESGFIENETFKETRFLKPPKSTYAVYMDSCNCRGSDDSCQIEEHYYTIEVYSYKADPTAEANIEKSFKNRGIHYEKQPRYWIDSEQLYQVVYAFNYIKK